MDGVPAASGSPRAHRPHDRAVRLTVVAIVAVGVAAVVAVFAVTPSVRWWQHRGPARAAIVARPAPAVRPVPVVATGTCAGAMAPVRALIATVPSGSLLSPDGNRRLTAGLAAVDAACDPAIAATFRQSEVVPWLTYLPPAVEARRA